LGKTREAIEWAIAYQTEQAGKDGTRLPVGDFNAAEVPAQTSIFVLRHQLAAGAAFNLPAWVGQLFGVSL
jgi:hypothetical protein